MNSRSNKKIPTIISIVSLAFLIYSLIAREYDPYQNQEIFFLAKNKLNIPISYYHVKLFGFDVPFLVNVFVSISFLAIGIYWYIQKEDEEIRIAYGIVRWRIKNGVEMFQKRFKTKWNNKKIWIYLMTLFFIVFIGFLIYYYQELNNSEAPKTIGQTIFMSFMEVASKILLIGLIITALKALFKKK